ncbi:DUF1631 family protein [Hydrogenophaga sp. A37]|uniref:DUF1631 family protein n=1 Tax=Hydrogenophaga sp. A37 TaxID=1945864 RepID=UPI00098763D1|nr:DUF1631 family protein [Hydrogenophaga sp. A37]OOG81799.1 hypothetical protein B0E41_16660 [Hydrogenophaga sp. A37]
MTQQHVTLLDQCTLEAERCAPDFLKRCIDATTDSLQSSENASSGGQQRQLLTQAAWSLTQSRAVLIRTYPRRLREAFQAREAEAGMTQLAELSDSSMMQLVDDLTVTESLEAVRLLQNLLPLVEHSLPVLDARMSSLIGLDSVRVEKNPLRPSVFVRALRELMAEIESDAAVRSLWLRHIAQPLGRELGQLYEQIALMLQRANVQEASYRIRLVDDPQAAVRPASSSGFTPVEMEHIGEGWSAAATGGGSMPGQNAGVGMKALGRSRSSIGGTVFQAFLGDPKASFGGRLNQDFYEQVDKELRQVSDFARLPVLDDVVIQREQSRYRDVPAVDRPARAVSIESPLRADRWGEYGQAHVRTRVFLELKQRAKNVSQALGLDLVRKLVNQVARDPLLLAPVREAVVALEPALLRLALAQPRYFGQPDHPARCLVEQVAHRSFRFNDEFSANFAAFAEPVREAFNQLNALQTDDERPFADALARLRERWLEDDAAAQTARHAQVQALQFAQGRQELADQVAWEISLRPDVFNVPEVVLDFLYVTWSLVIASAELREPDAGPDPKGYRAVVGTLLWSVRPEILRQPKEVFEALPGLVRTLHSGLDMLGKPSEETHGFFDALIRLHKPLLNLRRARARNDTVQSGLTPLETSVADAAPLKRVAGSSMRPVPAQQPWLTAQELAGAGFEDTLPDIQDDPVSDEPDTFASDAMAEQAAEEAARHGREATVAGLIAQLRAGSLVDLYSHGEWIRAELIWVSRRATLFMFTSHGGRAHSMTLRSCEKLVAKRWMRLVDTRAVVEVAMNDLLKDHPSENHQVRQPETALG